MYLWRVGKTLSQITIQTDPFGTSDSPVRLLLLFESNIAQNMDRIGQNPTRIADAFLKKFPDLIGWHFKHMSYHPGGPWFLCITPRVFSDLGLNAL